MLQMPSNAGQTTGRGPYAKVCRPCCQLRCMDFGTEFTLASSIRAKRENVLRRGLGALVF